MTRAKLIGLTALAVAVLGYGGFAGAIMMGRMEMLSLQQVLLYGSPLAVIGEIGLWIAAGSLGWSLFKGRKAFLDRILRRRAPSV